MWEWGLTSCSVNACYIQFVNDIHVVGCLLGAALRTRRWLAVTVAGFTLTAVSLSPSPFSFRVHYLWTLHDRGFRVPTRPALTFPTNVGGSGLGQAGRIGKYVQRIFFAADGAFFRMATGRGPVFERVIWTSRGRSVTIGLRGRFN